MKFFHFDSFDENYDSNSSDSVSDPWSEFDDEKRNHRVSKEAQEASIQEQFKDAVEALQNSNQQKALQILMSMFLSEPMREFYVENWRDFDWTAAANKSQRILSSMAKIYFSVNIALAGLVENPTSFYMQALSIYPRLTDVWFACGNEAARHGDWALAEFCFRKCEGEFRASEALLLLYFVTDELHKCLNCVAEILSHCADHCLARVIYAEMVRRDPLWAETFSAVFSIDFIATVDQTVHNTIISKIKCFRDSTSSHKRNTFVELLSLTRRSLAAFPIVLRRDMRMEELGTILCDAFSRIEMFSSLFKQNIIVTESREQVENDVCDDMIPSTSEYEFIDPAELVDERAVLDKIVSFVSGDMSNADEEAKQKRFNKKKTSSAGRKIRRTETAEGILANDELTRRRSTRFVEDVEANSTMDELEDLLKIMWTHMGVDDEIYEKMTPFTFSFAGADGGASGESTRTRRASGRSSSAVSDDCALVSMSAMSFEALISEFLLEADFSSYRIEHFLLRFLEFCTREEDGFSSAIRRFNNEQTRVFRQVYVRWCRTYTDGLFKNIPLNELRIHVLAAELGSPLALFVLRTHFPWTIETVDTMKRRLATFETRHLALFNRYLWLLGRLDAGELGFAGETPEFSLFRFINLTLLAQTIDENVDVGVVGIPLATISPLAGSAAAKTTTKLQRKARFSVKSVNAALYEESKRLYANQVDQLKLMGNYEELFIVLLNYYNFSKDDMEARVEGIFLLTKCALKTKRVAFALSTILAVLRKIRGRALPSVKSAKRALSTCVKFLDEIDVETLDEHSMCTFAKSLAELLISADANALVSGCASLWAFCYRVAKRREALNSDALAVFYAAPYLDNSAKMPTRALMVLCEAHDIVGRLHQCHRKQGMLLRLFMEEMYVVINSPVVCEQLGKLADGGAAIFRNVALEAYQCLICAFGESLTKIRNHYDDHGSTTAFDWECDWHLAEIVLPLIIPRVLPEHSTLEKIPNNFIEVILRLFPFVLEVASTKLSRLSAFVSNPPRMELREIYDSDGHAIGLFEEFVVDEVDDPRTLLYGADYKCRHASEDGESRRLALSAKCLYALAIFHYRANNYDEAVGMIRACLAICGPFLDDIRQSSAWLVFARCVTNKYSMLQDAQLLENFEEFLLPFKLTLFLKHDSSDARLDLASIMYQIRTRIKRFTEKNDVTTEQKQVYYEKIEGMLLKCRTHFELAKRYSDVDAEIPWLCYYFLAKISEKLKDSPEKVFKTYYECALAMEKEGYQYPQKIHRIKQTNFEPLEIHYKVHAYASKRFAALNAKFSTRGKSSSSTTNASQYAGGLIKSKISSADALYELRCLYANLKRFTYQAVEQKGVSKPEFYADDVAVFFEDLTLGQLSFMQEEDNKFYSLIEDDVKYLISDMVDYVELKAKVLDLLKRGFETIFFKFPHYKACYRLAELQFMAGKFRSCADTLFNRLFFSGKKRLTSSANIFENIVEITRADIERSGSFPYHIDKIVDMAIVASFRTNDMERLVTIMHSLLGVKNEQNIPDLLDKTSVANLRRRCLSGIANFVASVKVSQVSQYSCSQLGELVRKMQRHNCKDCDFLDVVYQRLMQKLAASENQKLKLHLAQNLLAQKRRAVGSDSRDTSLTSVTPPKQPRLTPVPTPSSHPLATTPTANSPVVQAVVRKPVISRPPLSTDVSSWNLQTFARFVDEQLSQLPEAERQRVFDELRSNTSRSSGSNTQRVLMTQIVEKVSAVVSQHSRMSKVKEIHRMTHSQQHLPLAHEQGHPGTSTSNTQAGIRPIAATQHQQLSQQQRFSSSIGAGEQQQASSFSANSQNSSTLRDHLQQITATKRKLSQVCTPIKSAEKTPAHHQVDAIKKQIKELQQKSLSSVASFIASNPFKAQRETQQQKQPPAQQQLQTPKQPQKQQFQKPIQPQQQSQQTQRQQVQYQQQPHQPQKMSQITQKNQQQQQHAQKQQIDQQQQQQKQKTFMQSPQQQQQQQKQKTFVQSQQQQQQQQKQKTFMQSPQQQQQQQQTQKQQIHQQQQKQQQKTFMQSPQQQQKMAPQTPQRQQQQMQHTPEKQLVKYQQQQKISQSPQNLSQQQSQRPKGQNQQQQQNIGSQSSQQQKVLSQNLQKSTQQQQQQQLISQQQSPINRYNQQLSNAINSNMAKQSSANKISSISPATSMSSPSPTARHRYQHHDHNSNVVSSVSTSSTLPLTSASILTSFNSSSSSSIFSQPKSTLPIFNSSSTSSQQQHAISSILASSSSSLLSSIVSPQKQQNVSLPSLPPKHQNLVSLASIASPRNQLTTTSSGAATTTFSSTGVATLAAALQQTLKQHFQTSTSSSSISQSSISSNIFPNTPPPRTSAQSLQISPEQNVSFNNNKNNNNNNNAVSVSKLTPEQQHLYNLYKATGLQFGECFPNQQQSRPTNASQQQARLQNKISEDDDIILLEHRKNPAVAVKPTPTSTSAVIARTAAYTTPLSANSATNTSVPTFLQLTQQLNTLLQQQQQQQKQQPPPQTQQRRQ